MLVSKVFHNTTHKIIGKKENNMVIELHFLQD